GEGGWWREDESEDLDCEEDIEDYEYTTSGDTTRTLKIRLSLTDEEMGEFKWIKNFIAKCTCDGVTVATALARYIHREGIRSESWERMEEPSEETCGVAFHVFDRYGTVQTKYKDHPVQRGTGVWGNDLDHGPLFLIEKLHVIAPELRRKGLGQRVVSLLLEKAKRFYLDDKLDGKLADLFYGSNEAFERAWTLHALVSPGILTADIESQLVGKSAEERLMSRTRIQSGAIDFWRSCGFRRIGASRCFALSFDLQHQSRALGATSDFDPRRSYAEDLENEELEVIYETDLLTLTDEELKAFFVTHADDEIGWDRVTNSEATLLHLTASELKPLSTRWLLENVHHADSWKTTRDIDGYTPLEALKENLETMRTRKSYGLFRILNVSDHFKGYPDTAVSCLSLLLGRDTSEEIDDGDFWIEDNDYILVHLDPDVRKNLKTNKSLRKGFVNIFQIAAECLKANRAPTAENVERCCNNRSEWPPDTKNYLRRAGTQLGCRAVLRYMFDAAKEEDEKAGN
ncbi:zinc knuckle transcription factor, partial [Penicillium bovifimosum]